MASTVLGVLGILLMIMRMLIYLPSKEGGQIDTILFLDFLIVVCEYSVFFMTGISSYKVCGIIWAFMTGWDLAEYIKRH